MATQKLIGEVRSTLTTGSQIWWSADWSCADKAETFFYWFDNTGVMYRAQLPNLANQTTITTVANPSQMRAMRAHPTDVNLLVYFNVVDGVNTINVNTGQIVQLMTASAFNAIIGTEGDLSLAYLRNVRIRGTKLVVHGEQDPSGTVWEYDPVNSTAVKLFANNALGRAFDLGPDVSKEIVLSGYDTPSSILYIVDLNLDQARVLAGIGTTDALTDGDAYKVSQFQEINRVFRAASDLFYVRDTNDFIRWIQNGQVGSYANWVLGGRFICQYLPIRNLVVSVGVQDVTVWQ
jgi:hypothetical protein